MSDKTGNRAFGLLCITGLSFWFALGFPFEHHNESYAWLPALETMNLRGSLEGVVGPVVTPRPLGILVAWLCYQLGEGSLPLVEALNFSLAVLGWALLFSCSPQKRTFAIVSLFTTGVLFSGYIYLFHLHGVFYSPLLVFLALICRSAERKASISSLLLLFATGIFTSLFHPFALLFLLAFLPVFLFESRSKKKLVALGSCLALLSLVVMKLMSRGAGLPLGFAHLDGLLVSFQSVEIHVVVQLISALFCLACLWSIRAHNVAFRRGLYLFSSLFIAFWWAGLPIVLLWLSICLFKLCLLGRWSLASLLGVAALLPAITATGSPTYTIFALFVAAFATAYHWPEAEKVLANSRARIVALSVVVASIALASALRSGQPIPALSRLAQPLLAEREKTWQMKQVIQWYLGSQEQQRPLLLHVAAAAPRLAGNAVNRKNRPPTQQSYLDDFINSRVSSRPTSQLPSLRVTFGNQEIPSGRLIFEVPGQFAGTAQVFSMEPTALHLVQAAK